MSRNLCSFMILSIVIILSQKNAWGDGLKIAVVSPLIRVFPTTLIENKAPKIEMWSARNEYETSQLAISSGKEIKVTEVSATDLTNKNGSPPIYNKNFNYKFASYVFLTKHTKDTPREELEGDVPGLFPDPLEEIKSIQFSGTRSILLTWYVPHGTRPGDYYGELKISTDAGIHKLPITLHVWNFTLPEKPSLYVTNWLYTSQIESHYHVKRGTKEFWSVIEKISQDMIEHRQSVIFTPLNLIRSTELFDGSYSFDFKDYEKWIDIFKRNGFQAFEGSHLFHARSSYDIRRSSSALRGKPLEMGVKQLSTDVGRKYLKALFEALYRENLKLGIQDKFIQHICDEAKPDQLALYREVSVIVRQAMPGVTIIDATELDAERTKGITDVPVTLIGKSVSREANQKWGKWWYTAVVPRGKFPNRFIDYPLIKMRALPWLSWKYGVSGYLHYAYNWWYSPDGKSPRHDVSQSGTYPPGDGFVVYPPLSDATNNAPVTSLRWEMFREGMEDFEYLVMLSKWRETLQTIQKSGANRFANRDAMLKQVNNILKDTNKLFASTVVYPRDPQILEMLRIRIGNMLDVLSQTENQLGQ